MAREGLDIYKQGPVYRVRKSNGLGPEAEVLLPENFPVEAKAFKQLANFAAVEHPQGGSVCRACATPDFHPGSLVPVGAIVASSELVIPQAIGTDINCGMRMHVADLTVDRFLARKEKLVHLLKGDLLLGTRDLPASSSTIRATYSTGTFGWLEGSRARRMGLMETSDLAEIEKELERVYDLGSFEGDAKWAPELPDRDIIRDGGLGTVGGGNHFVEIQMVESVENKALAWEWGVRPGQIAFMVHTGSRHVGVGVGTRWNEIAKERWPTATKWPEIFSLRGADAFEYMEAMHTAANYAAVNRMLIAEMVRNRMRQVFGDIEIPLVFDVPHNIVMREDDLFVHRKGATPAHEGQPVLIPGSMGHESYLMVGRGSERFLKSCSHGAGRAITRFNMTRKGRPDRDLGLEGIECITLRDERRAEEAPAAYKDIGPVVQVQVEQGLVSPVAVMKPLLTFKS